MPPRACCSSMPAALPSSTGADVQRCLWLATANILVTPRIRLTVSFAAAAGISSRRTSWWTQSGQPRHVANRDVLLLPPLPPLPPLLSLAWPGSTHAAYAAAGRFLPTGSASTFWPALGQMPIEVVPFWCRFHTAAPAPVSDLRPQPGQAAGQLHQLQQPGGTEPALAGALPALACMLRSARARRHCWEGLCRQHLLPGSSRAPAPAPVQAPEVMSGEKAGPAADVYSFGVVLWELCTLELPWSKTSPYQVGSVCYRQH